MRCAPLHRPPKSELQLTANHERKVYAWVVAKAVPEAVAQWQNKTWSGIFDGIQANCGMKFQVISESEIELTVNQTMLAMCAPLRKAVRESGGEFQVWVFDIPQQAFTDLASRQSMINSAVSVVTSHGLDGLSFDDETDCAPRSTLKNFTQWVDIVNELSDRFHAHGLTVSAAVQAMFGIEDVPYQPNQACDRAPWEYKLDSRVSKLMAGSSIDRWLEMDTYYFTTARFLNALDYYTAKVPTDKLGVAMMNRPELTPDDYSARFHAIANAHANWINMFMLPLDDAWEPWLRKWKTRCKDCPNAGLTSCYEPSVLCTPPPGQPHA